MTQTPCRFILCADDYALSPAVSAGILAAAKTGRVSATSAMTNRPFWPIAARQWLSQAPDAGMGLHLNLTAGAPRAQVPGLAPEGMLPSLATLMRLARQKALPLRDIQIEIAAQLDAFLDQMGCLPEFIDGHQHVHVLPNIAKLLLAELTRRKWQGRLWLRCSADRVARIITRRDAWQKAIVLAFLARHFAQNAKVAGFVCNDGFAGFSSFDPCTQYCKQFSRYLIAPGSRHLVMCHPGHVDDELARLDPVTATREIELQFLLSDQFLQIVSARGAELVRAW